MFYRNELQFLCDILRKSRVRTLWAPPDQLTAALRESGDDSHFLSEPWTDPRFPVTPEPCTLYQFTDDFDRSYLCLLLPGTAEPTLLLMGPYLSEAPTAENLWELGKKRGVTSAGQKYFAEYYAAIPVLREDCPLFHMITTFCERIWRSPSFAIVNVNREQPQSVPISEPTHINEFDDVMANIQALEKRYAFENEMIRAVTLGQLHKENQLFSPFSDRAFENRLPDLLRNAKNYSIIMNTLLRKAAENGGVHPVYLDHVSSEFAARIEQMRERTESAGLMREMFRTYCRLVRKHAMMHFSLVVQKAVLLIESDLSANLTLTALAQHQNVSPGYLSTIFKKDTGKTVSEYIREKRIQHAAYLLATTHQQIQSIALQCGIVDVQYFSKTFKKLTGMTPKEYRESVMQPQPVQ